MAFFLSPPVAFIGTILNIVALVKGPGRFRKKTIFGLVMCILLIPLLLMTYGLLNLIIIGHI